MNPGLLTHKLGKTAPVIDPRTLKLAKYLPKVMPPPPVSASFVQKVQDWGMMLNDELGNCVAAEAGHSIQQWTRYAGTEIVVPDSAILKTYEDVGGYIPGDDSTDNGMDMLTFLKYWRKKGVGGHKIDGFVSVDPNRVDEMQAAIAIFGNLNIGLQLPATVQGKSVWSVPRHGPFGNASPGTWGGHCVPVMAYRPNPRGTGTLYTVLSWGAKLTATGNFLKEYMDECYAVYSHDWLMRSGQAPSGFNEAQLLEDLSQL